MNWLLPDGSPFVGNAAAKALLSSRLDAGSFPHAILIEGPVGSGRRSLARLLAAAALCSEDQRPCGMCSACRKAFGGIHPDITELGGNGEARSFHIDVIRTLQEDAYILPNEASRRVFLLWDVENLTEQAQNALLKILEEPPAHVLFILTCEQRSLLLDTVLSRVFTVSLSGVSTEEALAVLQSRLPEKSPNELSRAVVLWGGIIGQALRGMEDGSYQEIVDILPTITAGITAPTELSLLLATAPLEKRKEAVPAVLSGLQLIFRDALLAKSGSTVFLGTCPAGSRALAQALTRPRLLALLSVIEDLQQARLRNMNHTLFITLLCARLRRAAGR
ncbi:MAG: DNA polymerase III subunit [Clostridia bacterium]|nr:DNA polymerase III subunit [Clostridia bacterium]